MQQQPKVSIIIPVYCGSDYLEKAIDSALSQSYPNIEVLVINDGSNDNGATEAIARRYQDKIRYFYKDNGGVASALNLGIREMTGEYFSWLSHDDLYTSDKIIEQVRFIQSFDHDVIVYSDFSLIDEDDNAYHTCKLKNIPSKHFRCHLTEASSLHGCTLLIPRKCFDIVGHFDESLKTTQDYALWFKMAKTFEFHHLAKTLVGGRQHQNQGTRTMGAVVSREGDELRKNFIEQLSIEEVSDYTNGHPYTFYLDMFLLFRSLQLKTASTAAFKLWWQVGKQHRTSSDFVKHAMITFLWKIPNRFITRVINRLVPTKLRQLNLVRRVWYRVKTIAGKA